MNSEASLAGQLLSEEATPADALRVCLVVDRVGAIGLTGELNVLNLDARGKLGTRTCLRLADNVLVGTAGLADIENGWDRPSLGGREKHGCKASDDGCLSHFWCSLCFDKPIEVAW